jgi:PKD repeat protein
MTWAMFVYDKCRIVGKDGPKWTISNTTNSSVADIYSESKYLTYLFKNPGKYMITLELTDTNGNKYKKDRNILNIKEIERSQQI